LSIGYIQDTVNVWATLRRSAEYDPVYIGTTTLQLKLLRVVRPAKIAYKHEPRSKSGGDKPFPTIATTLYGSQTHPTLSAGQCRHSS